MNGEILKYFVDFIRYEKPKGWGLWILNSSICILNSEYSFLIIIFNCALLARNKVRKTWHFEYFSYKSND